MRVERRTVDLTAYPDLVVIYLGMRSIRLPELRPCSASGRRLTTRLQPNLTACCVTNRSSSRCCLRMWGCASIGETFHRWNVGRDQSRICSGGRIFCAIPAAPDSGMRRISGEARSKPSMTILGFRWVCRPLPLQRLREDQCFRPAPAWASREAKP